MLFFFHEDQSNEKKDNGTILIKTITSNILSLFRFVARALSS